jgi:hypothetical protein
MVAEASESEEDRQPENLSVSRMKSGRVLCPTQILG